MFAETYGSTVVTRAGGVGGRWFNVNALDPEIASFRELELWFDGHAMTAINPVRCVDRLGGKSVAASNTSTQPLVTPSTATFDGPGFNFPKTAAQQLLVPDYVIPTSYFWAAPVAFSNVNTTVRGLFGHIDATGNRVRTWATQASTGADLGLFMHHNSAGPGNNATVAAGSSGVTHSARHLLWGAYDELTGNYTFGRGQTVLGTTALTIQHKNQAGMVIGGTGGSTQEMVGRQDAFLMASGKWYSAFVDNAVNAKRTALIALLGARYEVTV